MRVRPTELGLKGLLLLAALEVAFLATSYSNLFFLLIVFCCVLGGFGLALALRTVRAVRIVALDLPPGPAGAPRAVQLGVDVRRRMFDVAVTLLAADGERERDRRVPLPPIATVQGAGTVSAELPPLPRGVRAITAVRVATRFPFGLFEVARDLPLRAELLTHPAPAGTPETTARGRSADEGAGGETPTLVVAGLRPFRSGDAMRDVHWKATARRGAPVVKERERDAGAERTVVVDRRGEPDRLETALAEATAAVFATAAGDAPVRLRSQGFAARLAAGQPTPTDVLRWLATATPLPADAPPPDERTPREVARA